MTAKNRTPRQYMRLTRKFRDSLDWSKIKGKPFLDWARRAQQASFRPQYWQSMRDGGSAPREMILKFAVYLEDVIGLRGSASLRIADIAEPCEPEKSRRGQDGWSMGWAGHLNEMIRKFDAPDESYCEDEHDVALAARIIMECVGDREFLASGDAAIRAAEQGMRRSLGEYAAMLRLAWAANPNTIAFSTLKSKAGPIRVGTSVVLPVRPEFYERMRGGLEETLTITRDDLLEKSGSLVYEAVAESQDVDARSARGNRGMAQVRTIMRQTATLCDSGANPRIIAAVANQVNGKRATLFGFNPVGSLTPVTGKAIHELADPSAAPAASFLGRSYVEALGQHVAMSAMLRFFRSLPSREELTPDD
jgi:hypothetical protein